MTAPERKEIAKRLNDAKEQAYANGAFMTTATCTAGEHAKCDGTWRIGPLVARYLGQDEVEGPCDCECHSA